MTNSKRAIIALGQLIYVRKFVNLHNCQKNRVDEKNIKTENDEQYVKSAILSETN